MVISLRDAGDIFDVDVIQDYLYFLIMMISVSAPRFLVSIRSSCYCLMWSALPVSVGFPTEKRTCVWMSVCMVRCDGLLSQPDCVPTLRPTGKGTKKP